MERFLKVCIAYLFKMYKCMFINDLTIQFELTKINEILV